MIGNKILMKLFRMKMFGAQYHRYTNLSLLPKFALRYIL
jgi:hypothetical protein